MTGWQAFLIRIVWMILPAVVLPLVLPLQRRSSFLGMPYYKIQRPTVPLVQSTTMKIRVALVGLPNVGKSTLFNALAQQSIAQAANYPFCTIEPNMAQLPVPDRYLPILADMEQQPRKQVHATVEWVDVAGLCRGAYRGEGLGNRFLGTIRDCNAIFHVVRVFLDKDTVHVDGRVDPSADIQAIHLELLMADLEHVERRLARTTCQGVERHALEKVFALLQGGLPARKADLDPASLLAIKSMGLLTLKPVLYCFNVDEVDFTFARTDALEQVDKILQALQEQDDGFDLNHFALVSAKLESHLSLKSTQEQQTFLRELGVEWDETMDLNSDACCFSSNVLPIMVKELLGLSLVYTGPGVPLEKSRTTKAHLIRREQLTADGLAARLHGDIQKGFVQAEIISAPLLIESGSFNKAKSAGLLRGEGRNYVLSADDVVLIKWKP